MSEANKNNEFVKDPLNDELSVNSDNSNEKVTNQKITFWGFVKKHPTFSTIVVALAVIGIVILWKDISRNNWEKQVQKQVTKELLVQQESMIKLIAKTLVWNVRSEVLRNNIEQIDILFIDLVRDSQIEFVHYINMDGIVVLSTNKKTESQSVIKDFSTNILNTNQTITEKIDNLLIASSPIMGVDRQLGVVIIGYSPSSITLK